MLGSGSTNGRPDPGWISSVRSTSRWRSTPKLLTIHRRASGRHHITRLALAGVGSPTPLSVTTNAVPLGTSR